MTYPFRNKAGAQSNSCVQRVGDAMWSDSKDGVRTGKFAISFSLEALSNAGEHHNMTIVEFIPDFPLGSIRVCKLGGEMHG